MVMRRKALVLTYLFPPMGGMAPRRMLSFAHALHTCGFDVHVLTISCPNSHPMYKVDQFGNNSDLSDYTVHRSFPGLINYLSSVIAGTGNRIAAGNRKHAPQLFDGLILKIYRQIFKVIMIPDAKIDWLPLALLTGFWLGRKYHFDLILSHGSPFTAHIAAYFMARSWGSFWIADYGEPWSFSPESSALPGWRQAFETWLETKMLGSVSRVIVSIDGMRDGFTRYFPFLAKRNIEVVQSNFKDLQVYRRVPETKKPKFHIVYTGLFYDNVQNPKVFFDAISILDQNILANMEVSVAGTIDALYHTYVRKLGLAEVVGFLGYLANPEDVARLQRSADVLLLLGAPSGFQVPSKVYEYFAACRPILSVRYDDNDIAAAFVSKYRRGLSVGSDCSLISDALTKMFQMWRENTLEKEFDLDMVEMLTENQAEVIITKITDQMNAG